MLELHTCRNCSQPLLSSLLMAVHDVSVNINSAADC